MNISQKITSMGIIFLFAIAILVPLVGSFFQEDKTISHTEKRKLAQFPEFPLDRDTLVQFPREFEDYYNDQYGMRELFIKAFSRVKMAIGDTEIRSSVDNVPTDNTVKGKNGWFFLNRVWDGDPISDYRNLSLYSETDLLRAVFLFEARNDWLKRQGIRYLLFFAPNKHTIYSEYMPDYIVKQGDISSMDQLYDALSRYTSVEFVDLRDTLQKGKKDAHLYWKDRKEDAALYYKTDSHWNGSGADIVQYEVAKRLELMFPGLIMPGKRPLEDFVMHSATGDISLIMGRDDMAAYGPTVFSGKCTTASPEEFKQQQQVTTCKTGKLNALIFHDSFFTLPLKAFFADYFAQTTFLWETMSQMAVLAQLKKGNIDIVIEERAERFLPFIPQIRNELYNEFWAKHFQHWKKVIFTLDPQKIAGEEKKFTGQNITLQYDSEQDALDMQAKTGDPSLSIRDLPFKKDVLYMLYMEIDSPEKTQLQIFYSSLDPAIQFPDRTHKETYHLNKGKNSLYIPLFSGNLGDRLRLDPGTAKGLYQLKKFEIREVDPSSLSKMRG